MQHRRRAFTLIELLVVVLVLAVLAAIAIPRFAAARDRAGDATARANLRSTLTAATATRATDPTGTWPDHTALGLEATGLTFTSGTATTPGTVSIARSGGAFLAATTTAAGACHRVRVEATGAVSWTGPLTEGACAATPAPGGVVTTLAGTNTSGYLDATGAAARFWTPYGIEVAPDGTVVVVDHDNHRIRRITTAGVVTTIAGGGFGYADGTGTAARLTYPTDVAIAADGTMFVTDLTNHRIRRITPAGVVTTFAGSGTPGTADGTGTAAQFNQPRSIAIAPDGTLYVGESTSPRIRRITPAGVVTTLAGSGTAAYVDGTGTGASFANPLSMTVAPDGNLYVADFSAHAIRRVTPAGVVTTFAGNGTTGFADGTGTDARFANPSGITVAADGTFYVSDASNNRIRRISPAGVVTTLAGAASSGLVDGTGANARFFVPHGLTLSADGGTLFIADGANHAVRVLT